MKGKEEIEMVSVRRQPGSLAGWSGGRVWLTDRQSDGPRGLARASLL